jgi:hypothetical protein
MRIKTSDFRTRIRSLKTPQIFRRNYICFHVVVKMYRYSSEERVFIVKTYWITDSIKNCLRMFVEHFGGEQAPRISPYDWLTTRAASSYLIFSCCQLPFSEFPKHKTALHYRHDMQMYCTFVLFVNQHFPGLPASGTHCIMKSRWGDKARRSLQSTGQWCVWSAFIMCRTCPPERPVTFLSHPSAGMYVLPPPFPPFMGTSSRFLTHNTNDCQLFTFIPWRG